VILAIIVSMFFSKNIFYELFCIEGCAVSGFLLFLIKKSEEKAVYIKVRNNNADKYKTPDSYKM